MSSKNLNPFKDFRSDQIQRSSRKIFTAHYACKNAALNLTPVTRTTNGFIFQIINSLIESWGVCLTWLDCHHWLRNVVQGTGTSNFITYEQALRDALVARREKEVELATTSLEFESHLQFPYSSQSTELSDFRQSARSGNKRGSKQTLNNTSQGLIMTLLMSISANQHFALPFSMQIFKFQSGSCKLSFLFPPHHQSTQESLLVG